MGLVRARYVLRRHWLSLAGTGTVSDDYREALDRIREPHNMDFKRDDRGALTDPPAPIASEQPGYTDHKTFGPLEDRYRYIASLPRQWRFWADDENISGFLADATAVDYNYNGETWQDWDTIEIGDYFENRGYKFNGHAWYRCEFDIPEDLQGKPIFIHFGGITLHPVVGAFASVNGKRVWIGRENESRLEPTGVIELDITKLAKPGETNTLIVKIFNYGGPGGIYKNVKLATLR